MRRQEQRPVALPFDRRQGDIRRQTEQRSNLFGHLFGVSLGPLPYRADFFNQRLNDFRVFLSIRLVAR